VSEPKTDPDLIAAKSSAPLQPRPPLWVRSYGRTDAGRVRPSNEDHFAVVELARHLYVHQTSVPQAKAQYSSHRGPIFVIADGMGGHQAGEVVSQVSWLRCTNSILNPKMSSCCVPMA
jgi:serine/threonine protein phosphatase PrpC